MPLDALVFDAYGTLFDVHAVVERCDKFWPGKGAQLVRAAGASAHSARCRWPWPTRPRRRSS